jgi:hypothetical protein
MAEFTLSLNNQEYAIRDLRELRGHLDSSRRTQFYELWLSREGNGSLCILANGDRAWLMFLRHEGDAGFSSRNPRYTGPREAELEYYLSNGQRDVYPAHWAVDTGEALEAAEYFFLHGEKSPSITWHDDSQ